MKPLARLHGIALLLIAAIVGMLWVMLTWHSITRNMKAWDESYTYVVVFGDV